MECSEACSRKADEFSNKIDTGNDVLPQETGECIQKSTLSVLFYL